MRLTALISPPKNQEQKPPPLIFLVGSDIEYQREQIEKLVLNQKIPED